ncbi:MAG: YdcF family protein [Muribaculum sp.]|nr:YdcF family protein [Muribaculaceae bacterium]MCM1081705.1 YdcF family protein [Muribaculum sp.]
MKNMIVRRIIIASVTLVALLVLFTAVVNISVERYASGRIYQSVDRVPHNRVALLLGTSPLNRSGHTNSYFINRIMTAARLYHAGKVDFILASGDNHLAYYNEPIAMRDSLRAHGVPDNRIILDYAGFRTLDSVIRAKEVFDCDSITIISQADHSARALYLAHSNGINAVAVSAPLRAGWKVRLRMALREWLARDKMMLDIWLGKQPHFLGEKLPITEPAEQ